MEDSASASDAVPRPRKHNCTYPVIPLCVKRIGEQSRYLQRWLRLLDQKSGLMSDLKMYLKLTSIVPADHQADIQPTVPQIQQPVSIGCSNIHRNWCYVPQIASSSASVFTRKSLLRKQPLVKSQRVNRDATSVVINYQLARLRSLRQQMPKLLTSSLI